MSKQKNCDYTKQLFTGYARTSCSHSQCQIKQLLGLSNFLHVQGFFSSISKLYARDNYYYGNKTYTLVYQVCPSKAVNFFSSFRQVIIADFSNQTNKNRELIISKKRRWPIEELASCGRLVKPPFICLHPRQLQLERHSVGKANDYTAPYQIMSNSEAKPPQVFFQTNQKQTSTETCVESPVTCKTEKSVLVLRNPQS